MDQRIRVHADGEFSTLKRQLKGLETDFKRFAGVVDRGASKGGLFSKADLKALELYRSRYAEMDNYVQKSISEQIQKIRELERERQKAYGNEKKRIDDEIAARRKLMNEMRAKQGDMRERYERLDEESAGYGKEKGKPGNWRGLMRGGAGGMISTALGVLGLTSLLGTAMKAYQEAVAREKYIADLGMRIGGSRPDFAGLRRDITNTGLPYGYNGLESMMSIENVSNRMGAITNRDQAAVQGFTRAFGLDLANTSDTMGRYGQLGATRRSEMKEFADMLANSIEQSGMTARAAEQIQATKSLVEHVAQKQPGDIDSKALMAIQTVLNQTGLQGFMGERGANLLSRISSVFSSGDPSVSMFVDRALGWGTDKDYYQTQLAKERGLTDPQNLASVLGSVGRIGSGLSVNKRAELQDFALSHMTGISLTEAKRLREETNGFSNLSASNLNNIAESLQKSGTFDDRAGVRMDTPGGKTEQADARFEEALANAGDALIPVMNDLKDEATKVINKIGDEIKSIDDLTDKIKWIGGILLTLGVAKTGLDIFNLLRSLRGGGGVPKIPNGGAGGAGGARPFAGEMPGNTPKIEPKPATKSPLLGKDGKPLNMDPPKPPELLGPDGKPLTAKPTAGSKSKWPTIQGNNSGFRAKGVGGGTALWGGLLALEMASDPQGFIDSFNPQKSGGDAWWNLASLNPQVAATMQMFQTGEAWESLKNSGNMKGVGVLDGSSPLPSVFQDLTVDEKKQVVLDSLGVPGTSVSDVDVSTLQSYLQNLGKVPDVQKKHNETAEGLQQSYQDDALQSQKSYQSELSRNANTAFDTMFQAAKSVDGFMGLIKNNYGIGAGGVDFGSAYNPFSAYAVTSPFGATEPGIHDSGHKGVDFGMRAGTNLQAFMGGTIDDVGYNSSMGNYVTIKTNSGDLYRYMHMMDQSPAVVGSPVRAGDYLGQVGSTGDSTGPHLHMDYRKMLQDGSYQFIDPLQMLKMLPTSAPSTFGPNGVSIASPATTTHKIQVDVNVTGVGGASRADVIQIAKETFAQVGQQQIWTNPSTSR